MKRYAIVMICVGLLTMKAFGGTLSDIQAARTLSDQVAARLTEGQSSEAVELFKPYWPMPEEEIDALIKQIENQAIMIYTRFGSVLDVEFVTRQQVSDSLVRFIYLQKHEKHAIRWLFTFYKPRDIWLVNGIYFDDKVSELFEMKSIQ